MPGGVCALAHDSLRPTFFPVESCLGRRRYDRLRPDRPGHRIPAYLQSQGYRIIPVNPRLSEVLGEKAYPSLREIPVPVDVVEIFRRAEDVPPVVEEAIAIGAKIVWMQVGIINQEAASRAESAGLGVVMDTCMGATHQLLRSQGKL